jgi:hypothetical protein
LEGTRLYTLKFGVIFWAKFRLTGQEIDGGLQYVISPLVAALEGCCILYGKVLNK